jgi:hypothetical protein
VTLAGPAPPAVGVKVNVAAAPVLPATRSPAATANVTDVTAPPITPLDTALEGVGISARLHSHSPPALAGPNVQPASVTVTAVPAESAVPVTDNTMDVSPGPCGVSVVPG